MNEQVTQATKERILEAAERLFAEHGFAATSLRQITAEAGANLASVNYYFQSKEALILAVFARRLGPMNEERLRLLAEYEARAGDGHLTLEDVLRALLVPVLTCGIHQPGCLFPRLFGRFYVESGEMFGPIFQTQFKDLKARFVAAFRRAAPDLTLEDLIWRLHFTMGAAVHTMGAPHFLTAISEGLCDPSDVGAALERLIAFLAAGFRAPATASAQKEGQVCKVE